MGTRKKNPGRDWGLGTRDKEKNPGSNYLLVEGRLYEQLFIILVNTLFISGKGKVCIPK